MFVHKKRSNEMDRSVDSIGSCSLDVDAESTDFSDTSGSLNLIPTPSSARDIHRDFTARIKERCQISQLNCQETTTILDPQSGKISTIITTLANDTPTVSPAKKPSYLNLACCVNGYSNLTTYDSTLRRNINKSREVSPIRPSINTLQYCKTSGGFLAPPPIVISKSNSLSPSKEFSVTMENRSFLHQEGGVDSVDKAIVTGNGSSAGKFYSVAAESTTQKTSKSFIQQRVERLYGPGALAQGFYSPKKSRTNVGTTATININVLSERSTNSISMMKHTSTTTSPSLQELKHSSVANHMTVSSLHHYENSSKNQIVFENSKNGAHNTFESIDDLPVLRHLRPEFRAQLPIVSPKKSLQTKFIVVEENNKQKQQQTMPQQQKFEKIESLLSGSSPIVLQQQNGKTDKVNDVERNRQQNQRQQSSSLERIANGDIQSTADAVKKIKSPGQLLQSNGGNLVSELRNSYCEENLLEKNQSSSLFEDTIKSIGDMKVSSGVCEQVSSALNVKQLSEPELLPHQKFPLEHQKPQAPNVKSSSTVRTKTTDVENSKVMPTSPKKLLATDPEIEKDLSITPKEHNGNYFLHLLKIERDRLIRLAEYAENELEGLSKSAKISDEIFGYLRSASGKARLLATQKMKQFEGLCMNNLNQSPDEKFPTTNGDLQGFWDMVMLQVDHIDLLFKELEELKANNWKKPSQPVPTVPQGSKMTRRPTANATKTATTKNNNNLTATNGASSKKTNPASVGLAAQKREAQRKQLMEIKRKQKLAMSAAAAGGDGSNDQHQQSEQQQKSLTDNGTVEIFVKEPLSS